MNIAEKIAYAESHIRSISEHVDEDAQVRFAALDKLVSSISSEKAKIQRQVNERIAEHLNAKKE